MSTWGFEAIFDQPFLPDRKPRTRVPVSRVENTPEEKVYSPSSDSDGVAIMLVVENAEEVRKAGPVTTPDLHVTVAYFGVVGDPGLPTREGLDEVCRELGDSFITFEAPISSVTSFGKQGSAPVVALVDHHKFEDIRNKVLESKVGYLVNRDHGYTPHMTLGYLDADGEELPTYDFPPDFKVKITGVWLGYGDESTYYMFQEYDMPHYIRRIKSIFPHLGEDAEEKIRRVRTADGAERFGQPIGSIIVADPVPSPSGRSRHNQPGSRAPGDEGFGDRRPSSGRGGASSRTRNSPVTAAGGRTPTRTPGAAERPSQAPSRASQAPSRSVVPNTATAAGRAEAARIRTERDRARNEAARRQEEAAKKPKEVAGPKEPGQKGRRRSFNRLVTIESDIKSHYKYELKPGEHYYLGPKDGGWEVLGADKKRVFTAKTGGEARTELERRLGIYKPLNGTAGTKHLVPATPETLREWEAKWKRKAPADYDDYFITLEDGHAMIGQARMASGKAYPFYSDTHMKMASDMKYERAKEQLPAYVDMMEELGPLAEKDDTAALILFMGLTSARADSSKEQRGRIKSYGATSIEGRHVKHNADGSVTVSFTGKGGKEWSTHITDVHLISAFRARKDIKPDEPVFGKTSYYKAAQVIKEHLGPDAQVKDLRTMFAITLARTIVERDWNGMQFSSKAEFLRARKSVGEEVADALGNTPAMALNSYISPHVFAEYAEEGWL